VHARDHLDQYLAVRETDKFKTNGPSCQKSRNAVFRMECRNSVSCSIAGPNPSLEQSLNQLHIHDALCDNTRSHRLDTSRISSQNVFTPSKIYAVCVSRCAFLSLKMTRRWRNFCTSGWNKSNSRYKWFPVERRRNNWLPTKHTIS